MKGGGTRREGGRWGVSTVPTYPSSADWTSWLISLKTCSWVACGVNTWSNSNSYLPSTTKYKSDRCWATLKLNTINPWLSFSLVVVGSQLVHPHPLTAPLTSCSCWARPRWSRFLWSWPAPCSGHYWTRYAWYPCTNTLTSFTQPQNPSKQKRNICPSSTPPPFLFASPADAVLPNLATTRKTDILEN